MSTILDRMKDLGMSQVDMIKELKKRDIIVQPPEISTILRQINTYPKSKRVYKECEKIVSEHESMLNR